MYLVYCMYRVYCVYNSCVLVYTVYSGIYFIPCNTVYTLYRYTPVHLLTYTMVPSSKVKGVRNLYPSIKWYVTAQRRKLLVCMRLVRYKDIRIYKYI